MTEAIALILSTIISATVAYFVAERSARSAAKVARAEIQNAAKATRDSLRVQIKTSDAQIRASVLAGNRQAWINRLREEMAAFAAIVMHVRMEMLEEEQRGTDALNAAREEIYKRSMLISLLINPTEDDHERLVTMMEEIRGYIMGGPVSHDRLEKWTHEYIALSQTILKREWIRVKNLE